jgi:hypothetical protein
MVFVNVHIQFRISGSESKIWSYGSGTKTSSYGSGFNKKSGTLRIRILNADLCHIHTVITEVKLATASISMSYLLITDLIFLYVVFGNLALNLCQVLLIPGIEGLVEVVQVVLNHVLLQLKKQIGGLSYTV